MIFKTEKDRMFAYRNTFASPQSRQVLVDILGTLGFFDTKTGEGLTEVEQNVLNLYAKKILERCGFWHPKNYYMMVSNMLGRPMPEKKKRWWNKCLK